METIRDFNWFEKEAINAIITNNLSFSNKYYEEIDRQITEEMHKILDWDKPFSYSTYQVAVSLSTAKKYIEERVIRNFTIESDSINMNDVKNLVEKQLSECFVSYGEFDGEIYGFLKIKTNRIIYRAQISWSTLKSMTTDISFVHPMAFAGFCKE